MTPRDGKSDAATFGERSPLHPIAPADRQRLVAALAAEQWGVLRRSDLHAAGLTDAAIHRWLEAHRIHRLHREVYALVPAAALAPQGRELAAVWAGGDEALLFCVSAAVRWGLLRVPPRLPQVLVRASGRHAVAGIDLHVTAALPDDDRTTRERVPITTVERTILDLAAALHTVSDRAVESAAAQAERDGWFRRPAQLRTAARARDRPGSARLRRILDVGPRLWRSAEEVMAAVALVEAGLPEPVIAHRVTTDIGRIEVDLSFPGYQLVLEVDGGQHRLTLNRRRDVNRDAALVRLGWVTVRVTVAAVRADPNVAVRAVRPALVDRGWTPGG
jgi:very-short-patch-repair endonuclease